MLMVCGVAVSKTRPYPGFIKYQSPSLWKRMGQIRSKRDLRDNIAAKIGKHSFESIRYSRNILLELYSRMLKNEESAIEITAGLGLELEELIYLSGSTKASKKLQKIYDRAQELLLEGKEEPDGTEFFRAPVPSGNSKEDRSGFSIKAPKEKVEKHSENLDVPDSRTSHGGQKILTFGFDISPETSPETTNSENNTSVGNNTSDIPKPVALIPDIPKPVALIPDIPKPVTLIPDTSTSDDGFTSDILIPKQHQVGIDGIELTSDRLTSSSPEHDNLKIENSSSLSESFEKDVSSNSEPIENIISSELTRSRESIKESVNCDVFTKNIPDISEKPEVKTSEVPKKVEPKIQKTLFDF